jgi:hypothetical protein
MASVRVVLSIRLVERISQSGDPKRPTRTPLAAPLRVAGEEKAIGEGAPTSDTKDGDDMAPNSAKLVREGWDASVDRVECRLRSL